MTAPTPISIRDATKADAEHLAAGNARMAEETERRHLDPDVLRSGVEAVLTDPDKGRYWVAESGGVVIGQLMITREWSDWRDGSMWWIQSVYVDPAHRGRGVFSALYRHVESLARRAPDCCGLRLYMEPDNDRARRAYEALGMQMAGYVVMETDFGRDRSAASDGDPHAAEGNDRS